jgi:hypothetical protein
MFQSLCFRMYVNLSGASHRQYTVLMNVLCKPTNVTAHAHWSVVRYLGAGHQRLPANISLGGDIDINSKASPYSSSLSWLHSSSYSTAQRLLIVHEQLLLFRFSEQALEININFHKTLNKKINK